MSPHKTEKTREPNSPPTGSSRKKADQQVVPEAKEAEPPTRRVPKVRVVGQEERLTPEERKRRFATNLDMLIRLVGLSRVEAAHEIGLKHKLVLRLVSAGVSRSDDRNRDSLTRIAVYFALPSVDDLWRADLLRLVLSADPDNGFVEKFRPRLLAERERRVAEERALGQDELTLLSRALGFDSAAPALTGPIAAKIVMILASPKGEQFRRLIDDYHQLALVTGSVEGHVARKA
jgi:hypothetical protein